MLGRPTFRARNVTKNVDRYTCNVRRAISVALVVLAIVFFVSGAVLGLHHELVFGGFFVLAALTGVTAILLRSEKLTAKEWAASTAILAFLFPFIAISGDVPWLPSLSFDPMRFLVSGEYRSRIREQRRLLALSERLKEAFLVALAFLIFAAVVAFYIAVVYVLTYYIRFRSLPSWA